MADFWDYSVWGGIILFAVLLLSLLVANTLKRKIPLLKKSLIPTSVLGGLLLLLLSVIYKSSTGTELFNTAVFGGNGMMLLEAITYHSLAIGFIATSFKPSKEKINKKRTVEVFNTGLTTVATYLIQGIVGLIITLLISSFIVKDFFPAAGILLPFGFGQGTGQAMNYGNIYEMDYGFVGGKSFGLTIAALGFLSASLGGVIRLHVLKVKGKIQPNSDETAEQFATDDIQTADEIPMNGSIDKITVQMGFVFAAYLAAYFLMYGLGLLLPGLKSILYGFNFLFGVLVAVAINSLLSVLRRKEIMKRQYVNSFLMNRISGFFFDIMIVAGIAAIQLDVLKGYGAILLLLGIVGMAITYWYVLLVCRKLYPDYTEEQFLAMYGMLTGTASTGIILLREVDKGFTSNAAENLVYQNLPAIVFGFPMMIVATMAPKIPLETLGVIVAYFVVLNIILFRSKIFKKKV
ncbi:MAG: hypothetical protein J6Q42_02460 [Clostridia bacterium]|nr:hypothetical protein [Clostridia bacterium]